MSVDLDDEVISWSDTPKSWCWGCGKMKSGDEPTCGTLRCLTLMDEMNADEINHKERQIKTGMWNAMFEWCGMHRDWRLSIPERVLYTCKAWICGLFGWRSYLGYEQEPIDVANIDFHTTYAGWDHTWLRVGGGVFTNWCYELAHDSDWNM